ncbi:discoidin domain-containing protein, partial [Crossiella equi]|uniref:discoidin domain-containing protein n=1 Tax=Crossiella equi TaxID=130796 RepID=UPI001177E4EA
PLELDLADPDAGPQVQLQWEAAYGKRFALEVSGNGADWRPFYTETAGSGGTQTLHTHPREVVGRYVRLRGIERATPWGYSLFSFVVKGGVPTPAAATERNLALHHPVFSDYYQHAGNSPAFAVDGGYPENLRDDTSRWSSDWSANRSITVDLGASARVNRVELYWQAAYAVDYALEVSTNNRDWVQVHRPSAAEVAARRADVKPPGEAAGRIDRVSVSATGRYLRMRGIERRSFYNPAPHTAQFGYSLYEFQVWGTGGDGSVQYPAAPTTPGGAYQTTFFEDFNGSALDRGKWRVQRTGATFNPVNGEAQAYVDSPETIAVRDGQLHLTAKHSPGFTAPGGGKFDFTSGRIDTNTKFDFTYGRVTARMRLPVGDGYWPAFWLLGSDVDNPNVSWPASGETDIMENIGYGNWVSGALHGPGYSADGNIGKTEYYPNGGSADQWHTYGAEWTPQYIAFTLDGREFHRITRDYVESVRGQWVFDKNQYLILNFALGGAYPAGHNKVTQPYWGLPQSSVDRVRDTTIRTEVDWVRVEQRR